jgi:hypothetical protein
MGGRAREAPKPYDCLGLGDIDGPKAYKFIRLGDIDGPKAVRFIRFGDLDGTIAFCDFEIGFEWIICFNLMGRRLALNDPQVKGTEHPKCRSKTLSP